MVIGDLPCDGAGSFPAEWETVASGEKFRIYFFAELE